MKTIGFIGGLSWESTEIYYRILNEEVKQRLGGKHSARIQMYSFDFDEIDRFLKVDDFEAIGQRMIEEALKLEKLGADLLVLGANTAHKWAEQIRKQINIPLIHIANAVGDELKKQRISKVLLFGTKYTMEENFIKSILKDDYDIEISIPEKFDRTIINNIIYDELILGRFYETSINRSLEIIQKFKQVEGVILGCTELPLIIKPENCSLPLFNTTDIHAKAIVDTAVN